jgi:SnoaL-like domain
MSQTNRDTMKFVDTLIAAVNNRDLEGLVECFDADYVNVNPAHPQRGFQGREQVRRNWSEIFRSVPDIRLRWYTARWMVTTCGRSGRCLAPAPTARCSTCVESSSSGSPTVVLDGLACSWNQSRLPAATQTQR